MGWEELGDGGSAAGASVETLSLDLVAHVLAGVRDPRDRKACHLVSSTFVRVEAAPRRMCREALQGVLRVFPCLDDASLRHRV
ncbi:hypothetical protein ACP4OV_026527 [Aristida adscensionis]